MAVNLQFGTIILRKDAIKNRYDGGWTAFFDDYKILLGISAWYDEHLFCLSFKSSRAMRATMRELVAKGMVMFIEQDGQPIGWQDGCVLTGMPQLNLPCDWIETSSDRSVYLRGSDPGPIARRHHFRPIVDLDDPIA